MKHGIKKIKFKKGKNANKMLVRKLLYNFVLYGKLTTTKSKAKVLKSSIERIINKAKTKTQANSNYIFKILNDRKIMNTIETQIAPIFKDKGEGCVKMISYGQRSSDGSEMVKVEWSQPIIKSK